jgi:hypothetical protein
MTENILRLMKMIMLIIYALLVYLNLVKATEPRSRMKNLTSKVNPRILMPWMKTMRTKDPLLLASAVAPGLPVENVLLRSLRLHQQRVLLHHEGSLDDWQFKKTTPLLLLEHFLAQELAVLKFPRMVG